MSSGGKPAVGLLDRARCNSVVLTLVWPWVVAVWICGSGSLPAAVGQETTDAVEESVPDVHPSHRLCGFVLCADSGLKPTLRASRQTEM